MRPPEVTAALEHLRALPAVDAVELRPGGKAEPAMRQIAIRVDRRWHVFRLEVVARKLDGIQLEQLRTRAERNPAPPLLIVAQHIPKLGRETLRKHEIAHVDAAGNCFLQLGRNYLAWVEGRPQAVENGRARGRRGLGANGYQAEFALLAEPEMLNRPVRDIAAAAGVAKTVVAELLVRLRDQGLIVGEDGQRRLVDRQRLIDDWLGGYARILRPKLLIGEFEAADAGDVTKLQARLKMAFAPTDEWAFGGGIAAHRWTAHWRGDLTVLHVARVTEHLPKRLGLLPVRRGRIKIMRAPCRAAINGKTHLAHPLLAYAELMNEDHERAREAALEVRQHFPDIFE